MLGPVHLGSCLCGAGGSCVSASRGGRTRCNRRAPLAAHGAFEHAHDADEGSAILARIAFGRAFFLSATTADHRIALVQFGHA